MQGRVSQNFDLGPSFDFMKCRNLNIKKMTKSYPFFLHKIKSRTLIKKLRHASLKRNLCDTHRTFKINNIHSN